MLAELLPLSGIFIRSAITVDCPAYLEGLWQAAKEKGVRFEQAEILSAPTFDKVIFTVGADLDRLQNVDYPPVQLIKGQTLELEWEGAPLPFPVNGKVQFSQVSPNSVWAGATYERNWTTRSVDTSAEDAIRQKVAQFSPAFSKLPLKRIWAGMRAATKDKLPFITHTAPNIYCLGGMGSKGLLYHAFMAKKLLSLIDRSMGFNGHVKEEDDAWR